MDPIMSQVKAFIFLGNSNFPEDVKLGCPTMSMENFTILGVPGGPQSISPNGLH